jgi:hypothetical protein
MICFPPFCFRGIKKDLYPRRAKNAWIKVLLSIQIVPRPGLSAVLTDHGPAISPAGSYSPLW